MTHTLELQLRMLVRENLVDEIDSDPLDIYAVREIVRESIQLLIQENASDRSFWSDFDWPVIASWLEDALSALGFIAAGVVVVAGGAAAAPVAAAVVTGVGIATIVISLGQAIDKGMDGDYYGMLFEIVDMVLAFVGIKFLPPGVSGPIKTRITSLLFDFISFVVGKIMDYIDGKEINADEKRRMKEEVSKAGAAAKRGVTGPGAGSATNVNVVSKQELLARAVELGVNDFEDGNTPLTPEKLVLEIGSTFSNIDIRAIEPLSNDLHSAYIDAYTSGTQGNGSEVTNDITKKVRREIQRLQEPKVTTDMYQFVPADGTIVFIDSDPNDGVMTPPMMLKKASEMKRGEALYGSSLKYHGMSYDDMGRVESIILRGPKGNLIKVPPVSRPQ